MPNHAAHATAHLVTASPEETNGTLLRYAVIVSPHRFVGPNAEEELAYEVRPLLGSYADCFQHFLLHG